jgi:hypothetical protein
MDVAASGATESFAVLRVDQRTLRQQIECISPQGLDQIRGARMNEKMVAAKRCYFAWPQGLLLPLF